MFIPLKHKSLDVYVAVRALTKEVYKVSMLLPVEEKFNKAQPIRRVALAVKLNLAEGSTRRSDAERKRYFETAKRSVAELDAALETAIDLNYYKIEELQGTADLLNKCFVLLSKMTGTSSRVCRLTSHN